MLLLLLLQANNYHRNLLKFCGFVTLRGVGALIWEHLDQPGLGLVKSSCHAHPAERKNNLPKSCKGKQWKNDDFVREMRGFIAIIDRKWAQITRKIHYRSFSIMGSLRK